MACLAVVSMVRNEEDVIESFVRHNLIWADRLYVAVHASTDRTYDILLHMQQEGLPLVLSQVAGAAQRQAEVITGLACTAVKEGADFVLPLDGDEFLLPDANLLSGKTIRKTCRDIFSALDRKRVYTLAWRRYLPEKGEGFIPARPAIREKSPEELRKVLLGAGAMQAANLEISQGSHCVLVSAGAMEPQEIEGVQAVGMHIAHYPWRSSEQAAAKAAVGWLGNVAKYSRYTRNANHWRKNFLKLMMGEQMGPEPLHRSEKAPQWEDKDCVKLLYTPPMADFSVLSSVLKAAEELAEECCVRTVQQEARVVSIVISYKGNIKGFEKSLDSAVSNEYPYKEYIVWTEEPEDKLSELEQLLAEQPVERIALFTGPDALRASAEAVTGEFLQWLPEGDMLLPGRLTKMSMVLVTQPELGLVLSAVRENEVLHRLQSQGKVLKIDTEGEVFLPGDGTQAAQTMRESHQIFAGGAAACLCRCTRLEQSDWELLTGEMALAALMDGKVYGYFAEPLIEISM